MNKRGFWKTRLSRPLQYISNLRVVIDQQNGKLRL